MIPRVGPTNSIKIVAWQGEHDALAARLGVGTGELREALKRARTKGGVVEIDASPVASASIVAAVKRRLFPAKTEDFG